MVASEMARLEELTPGSLITGILPDAVTELVSAKWHGSDAAEVVYKDTAGGRDYAAGSRPWQVLSRFFPECVHSRLSRSGRSAPML